MNEIVIALIASGTISTVLNLIVTWIKETRDRKYGLRASMRTILDDRLTWMGEKHIEQGYITMEQLKIYTKMHEQYKSLGGNGYHTALMTKIQNLPIKGDK